MKNSRKRAVSTIKATMKIGEVKGLEITEERVAGRLGITPERLHAQLYGDEETPDDLSTRIYEAYKEEYEALHRESNSTPLRHIVGLLRELSMKHGPEITEMEIAGKMGVSMMAYERFMEGIVAAPREMIETLWDWYGELLQKVQPEGRHIRVVRHVSVEEVRIDPDDEEEDDDGGV